MPEEMPKFPKIEKVGISISVDKDNLNKLKEYIKENDPNSPLSHPFNIWLNGFVKHIELSKKQKESEVKKESEEK